MLICDTSSWRKHREEDLSIRNNLHSCQPPFPLRAGARCVIVVWTRGIGFTAMLCYAQVFLTHQDLSRWIIFLLKFKCDLASGHYPLYIIVSITGRWVGQCQVRGHRVILRLYLTLFTGSFLNLTQGSKITVMFPESNEYKRGGSIPCSDAV